MDIFGHHSSNSQPLFVNALQPTTSQLTSMLPQLSAVAAAGQISGQIGGQIGSQLGGQIGSQLGGQIGSQLSGQISGQIGGQIGGHHQLGAQFMPSMAPSPLSFVSPTDFLRMNMHQQDPHGVLGSTHASSNKNLFAAAAAATAANHQQIQQQAAAAAAASHHQQQAAAAQQLLQAAAAAPSSHQIMNHHLTSSIPSAFSNSQSFLGAGATGSGGSAVIPTTTAAAFSAALQQAQQFQNQLMSSQLPLLNLPTSLGSFGNVSTRNVADSRNHLATAVVPTSSGSHSKSLKSVSGSQYIDYAKHPGANDPVGAKGARDASFPVKLYRMLEDEEFSSYISWMPHGRAWKVLRQDEFEEKVIPLYFRHAKFASFMRQVNGWGFRRVSDGLDRNSYYHEMFLRGFPHLCAKMRRPTESVRNSAEPRLHPNFYDVNKFVPLPSLPPQSSSSSSTNTNSATSTAGSIPHTVSQSSCSSSMSNVSSQGIERNDEVCSNDSDNQLLGGNDVCNSSASHRADPSPINTTSRFLEE